MALYFEHNDEKLKLLVWKINEPLAYFLNRVHLTKTESDLLESFKHETRKLEYVISRYLLIRMNGNDDLLSYETTGKPFLTSGKGISITHCKGYVGLALSKRGFPGIDLEEISERPCKIQQRFLNQQELRFADNDPLKNTLLWSTKEALFKMCQTQGIDFRTNLTVEPFKADYDGTVHTVVNKGNLSVKNQLSYKVFQKIVLVWGINYDNI